MRLEQGKTEVQNGAKDNRSDPLTDAPRRATQSIRQHAASSKRVFQTARKSVHGFRSEEHAVPHTVVAALGAGPAHASTRPLRIVWQWTRSPRVPVVSGCISGPGGCACYSKRGRMLDLTHSECLTALMRPLPFDILGSRRGGGGGPSRSGSAPLPAPSLLHAGPTVSRISSGPGHGSGWGTRSSALRVNYQPPAYSGGHTGGTLQ